MHNVCSQLTPKGSNAIRQLRKDFQGPLCIPTPSRRTCRFRDPVSGAKVAHGPRSPTKENRPLVDDCCAVTTPRDQPTNNSTARRDPSSMYNSWRASPANRSWGALQSASSKTGSAAIEFMPLPPPRTAYTTLPSSPLFLRADGRYKLAVWCTPMVSRYLPKHAFQVRLEIFMYGHFLR